MTTLVVRTSGDPALLAEPIRASIRGLDPNQPIRRMETLRGVMAESLARDRFFTMFFAAFGGLALLLAVVGVYGVIAYTVGQRTREIGIRMALGARRFDVLRNVVGGGMRPIVVGILAGLVLSLAFSRVLANQLYGVSATDPAALTVAVIVLAAAAFIACTVPAVRAARVDPALALRDK
jgi:ABC-type antimicrobial peptide transport system permease subunit